MSKNPLYSFMLDALIAISGLYKMKRVELMEKSKPENQEFVNVLESDV